MRYGLSEEQLKEITETLASFDEIEAAILFGSRAIGTFKEASDIDIAIKGKNVDFSLASNIEGDFEESDLPFFFDIIAWPTITSKDLKKHIWNRGKVIYRRGWREVKLKDVAKSNSQNIDKTYPHKEILYLDTGSITEGKISDLQPFNIDKAPSRAKRLVKNNDIIYSTVRPIQRHYGFIKNPHDKLVVSTGFSVIETNNKLANSLFIYYLLSSRSVIKKLDIIAEGSTTTYPSLRSEDIENLEFFLPPLAEQKTIAEILSSLDDKIELLHRQNKTLEDMAQALFQKWFVEGKKYKRNIKKLNCYAEHRKITIKPSGGIDSLYLHYSIPAFDKGKNPAKEMGKDIKSNKYKVLDRTILVSKLNPRIPRTWAIFDKVEENAICSTEFQVVAPRSNDLFGFIYCFLKSKSAIDNLSKAASGTSGSHQRVRPEDIFNLAVAKPESNLLAIFSKTTDEYWEKISNNNLQINTLKNLRHILLPNLICGKLKPSSHSSCGVKKPTKESL